MLVVDGDGSDWNSYDGMVTERSVDITNVTAIDNNFHGRLHIIQGEDEGVRLRGKGKSLEKVSIEQKGETLFLDTRVDISFDFAGWEYHYPEKLDVYVTVANLDRLEGHGHAEAPRDDDNRRPERGLTGLRIAPISELALEPPRP